MIYLSSFPIATIDVPDTKHFVLVDVSSMTQRFAYAPNTIIRRNRIAA